MSRSYSRYFSTATATAAGTVKMASISAPWAMRAGIPGVSDKITDGTSVTATRQPE